MGDERERALSRAPSGDLEARAGWLRARLRAGELLPNRVRLLAFLGDEGAVLASGQGPGPDPGVDPAAFFLALVTFDSEAACRLGLRAAQPLLQELERHADWEERPRLAIEAAWAWLETEDLALRESARVAASQAAEDAEEAAEMFRDLVIEGVETELAFLVRALVAPVRLATELREESLPTLAGEVFRELVGELGILEPEGTSFLLEAVEDLSAWCLMTR